MPMQISISNSIGGGGGNLGSGGGSSFTNTKSIALDGVDDFVSFSDINLSGVFSISFWFKFTGTFNVSGESFIFGEFGNSNNYIQLNSATSIILRIGRNSKTYTSTTQTISQNAWNHLMIIRDASNVTTIYLNGQVFKFLSSQVNDWKIQRIGRVWNAGRGFLGGIDEFAIFSSDLTSDVSTIYGSGVPSSLASYSPVHWYRCGDGDTSPTLTDNGSGGNNGTMTNFSTFSTDVPT